MPWAPELFTAPALQRVLDQRRRERLASVPYFDGLLAGEPDALVGSFAGEPELHDPVRGRVRGVRAFTDHVVRTRQWLDRRGVTIESGEIVLLAERGVEEDVLHVDGGDDLPFAVVTDHAGDRIAEMRLYFGATARPPLLQADPTLRAPDVVGAYQGALADGDLDAAVAAFAPGGAVTEPSGAVHQGTEALRAFHARLLAGGGVPRELCTLVDDGRFCALEYNRAGAPPQAALCVHERGPDGRLAAVRVYGDAAAA